MNFSFREIDDIAFQDTLRRVHLLIENAQYSEIWQINDYAYGWIYWAPTALITYPLYILSSHTGLDWPLIVTPRQFSLFFAILSLFVLRKILTKIGVSQWLLP